MLPPIILASQSPRRRDLLHAAGVDFIIITRDTDELHDASMPAEELCLHNARAKAAAVAAEYPAATVIGADTLVFLDTQPLGKPRDEEEARAMLCMLSGRTHLVCTAVSLQSPLGVHDMTVVTEVAFKHLSEKDVLRYMELVHVLDKAGAYALQEHGEMIVAQVNGDTDNVIGLPAARVADTLRAWGYSLHNRPKLDASRSIPQENR